MARFASHCGIIGAHPKQSRFQLPLQLGAKCLVISQLTIGILGILRRPCIPLATDPHTTMGVNSRSSNNSRHTRTGVNSSSNNNSRSNSRSNSNSSKFEALHFTDLTTDNYVTDCAQIVVYYWWAAQTALSAVWDTMGVAWVVRDSLWDAACASAQRRKRLVKSWAERTLQASSIDMSFAPPLIVAQVYNMSNGHWVLRLLLIAPTREYLCLKFDPMCDQPHIVGANQEELAVVDLIAERKGVDPQQRKRWSKILDAFGALAFAIAPLHSTFIQQLDGVSCHPACLLTLHCALSWRVVKGILQVPQDRLWLLREMAEATLYFSRSKLASTPRTLAVHWEVAQMYPKPKTVDPVDTCFSCDGTPHMACHECKVLHCALHVSILCQSEICVGLRQFWTNVDGSSTSVAEASSTPLDPVPPSSIPSRIGVGVAAPSGDHPTSLGAVVQNKSWLMCARR